MTGRNFDEAGFALVLEKSELTLSCVVQLNRDSQ
jgi:hypothetical protein